MIIEDRLGHVEAMLKEHWKSKALNGGPSLFYDTRHTVACLFQGPCFPAKILEKAI